MGRTQDVNSSVEHPWDTDSFVAHLQLQGLAPWVTHGSVGHGWLCGTGMTLQDTDGSVGHRWLCGTSMGPWDMHSSMGHGWLHGTSTGPWDIHSSKGHVWFHETSIGPWDMDGAMGHVQLHGTQMAPWDMHGPTGHMQHCWEGTVGTGEPSLAQDPNWSRSVEARAGAAGPLQGPLLLARTPSPAGVPPLGKSPLGSKGHCP